MKDNMRGSNSRRFKCGELRQSEEEKKIAGERAQVAKSVRVCVLFCSAQCLSSLQDWGFTSLHECVYVHVCVCVCVCVGSLLWV